MASVKYNINVDQGSTYKQDFYVVDASNNVFDLTGYVANAAIKQSYTATNSTWLTTNITQPNTGIIELSLDGSTTGGMTAGRYNYDVFITSSNGIYKVVEGFFTINPSVTPSA